MGRAHALALAKQGAKVAITDIDDTSCQAVADEITDAGGIAACYAMDVSNAKQVDEAISTIVEKFGRLDILVNNAGIYEPKAALDLTEEEWERTIHINLKGQFLCAQRAASEMRKNAWGRIINISSIASGGAGVGLAGGVHYAASKGGVIAMTETLAVEWAPLGILVNTIAPGAIDTPMAPEDKIPKEMLDKTLSGIPLNRFGKSEEVAAMVVYLASNESSYTTGATFYIDGGWLAA